MMYVYFIFIYVYYYYIVYINAYNVVTSHTHTTCNQMERMMALEL